MDLWIRSQDKRTLIQPNRIDIDDKAIIVWQNNYNCDETYLGTYKTKERALEVLDEIQGRISKNECLKSMIPKVTDIRGYEEQFGQLFKDIIYEMPEE